MSVLLIVSCLTILCIAHSLKHLYRATPFNRCSLFSSRESPDAGLFTRIFSRDNANTSIATINISSSPSASTNRYSTLSSSSINGTKPRLTADNKDFISNVFARLLPTPEDVGLTRSDGLINFLFYLQNQLS